MKSLEEIINEALISIGKKKTYLRDIHNAVNHAALQNGFPMDELQWKMLEYILKHPEKFKIENRNSGRITLLE